MVAEELKVVIRAETQKAVRELGKIDKQMGKSEKAVSSFAKLAKSAAGMAGVVVAVRQVVRVMGDMVDAYAIQEKAEARLEQVIRSTGGAAGFSADELKAMASAMQKVTTYGDEVILGAQSMLLTFTKVGRDVFPQATEAIMNMATAMDQDLRSVTIQVGKALNDPIQGITALGRAGVQFTEDQKALIKTLVETNDTAAAQEVILAELETQFGGMARAVADTATGAMVQFKNSLGDLKEVGGEVITGFLQPFAEGLNRVVDALMKAVGFGPAMEAITEMNEGIARLYEKRRGSFWAQDYEQLVRAAEAMEDFVSTYGDKMSAVQRATYGKNIRYFRESAAEIEDAYAALKTYEKDMTHLQGKRREAVEALTAIQEAAKDPLQRQLDYAIKMNAEWYALYLTAKDVGGAEYAEPLLEMTRYWLERQHLIIEAMEDTKELIEDIAGESSATAEHFADIARDTKTSADNIFDMVAPLSGLEKAVEGGLLPAVQDTTAAVWDLDVATVEAGVAAGGVASGWEEVAPAVKAAAHELDMILPKVEEAAGHIKSIYGKGDEPKLKRKGEGRQPRHKDPTKLARETADELQKWSEHINDAEWAMNSLLDGDIRGFIAPITALFGPAGQLVGIAMSGMEALVNAIAGTEMVMKVSDSISYAMREGIKDADWDGIEAVLLDGFTTAAMEAAYKTASLQSYIDHVAYAMTKYAKAKAEGRTGWRGEDWWKNYLDQAIADLGTAAEEAGGIFDDLMSGLGDAFTTAGDEFSGMIDTMQDGLQDVLREINRVYDEEVWLLQHLLDKGMIGVEEYLRRLREFQAAKAAAEGAAGGGGSTTGVGGGPSAPYIPSASLAPAAAPSYSVIITAPTGNAEEIARTVKRGIKSIDRRRR